VPDPASAADQLGHALLLGAVISALRTPNAIGSALGLLGDEWSLLIVRESLFGARRFGELQPRLGIGPTVLSARLTALVEGGVLRKDEQGYRLTQAGTDVWRLLLCIWAWEQHWVQGDALPVMRHAECGAVFHPVLSCRGCGIAVEAADVEVTSGPSGAFSRSVPTGSNRRRSGLARREGPGLFPETMALMGSRWSSALLGAAFLGAQRFSEFEAMLQAPANVVAERLRQFVGLGVLTDGYRLTPKGRAFFPAVAELVAWGEKHHPAPDGPALLVSHDGHGFLPALRCSVCDASLRRKAVAVEPAALTTASGGG
jgi:DNA-binding HxlR family transcriptional regulator